MLTADGGALVALGGVLFSLVGGSGYLAAGARSVAGHGVPVGAGRWGPGGSVVPVARLRGVEGDYLVVSDVDGVFGLDAVRARVLCDQRTGLGGDGVLRVVRTAGVAGFEAEAGVAPWFMDYRTADGSLGLMCGDGLSVFARYLVSRGLAAPGRVWVATWAGVRSVWVPVAGRRDVAVRGPTVWPGRVGRVRGGGRHRAVRRLGACAAWQWSPVPRADVHEVIRVPGHWYVA